MKLRLSLGSLFLISLVIFISQLDLFISITSLAFGYFQLCSSPFLRMMDIGIEMHSGFRKLGYA